ncbi:hypothetical protein GDO81_022380 [Engystomops pustulosus]|uniref:Uncharacterized protein n=1 Tax=Engystomops pustulosus TaxID=76066 RepID=A0AAV6ZLZ5_ENGPU|nr:hypothetical protein GDO81_022380 [Engystomops pustulosus]
MGGIYDVLCLHDGGFRQEQSGAHKVSQYLLMRIVIARQQWPLFLLPEPMKQVKGQGDGRFCVIKLWLVKELSGNTSSARPQPLKHNFYLIFF